MEFKDLPLKVQEIAAQCLADKIKLPLLTAKQSQILPPGSG